MNQSTLLSIIKSWINPENALHSLDDIKMWIQERNGLSNVTIKKNKLSESNFWYYDHIAGEIRNKTNSFFSICGLEKTFFDNTFISQPIIIQTEVGYLGIICKEINGVMHFLMQAKIEPGNVNKIQISPTIQATKSNFMQKHGGAKPPYLEYFEKSYNYEIVVDQIQSEQSSRFYKKRNRNMIIRVDEDITVLPSHKWLTLKQIKSLMQIDNLVNMDTRTILSCIPYFKLNLNNDLTKQLYSYFSDKTLFNSIFKLNESDIVSDIYHYFNDYKMFQESQAKLLPLHMMHSWSMSDDEVTCNHEYPYKIVFCDIAIEGREVKHWTQPLFEALGIATFGLICCEHDEKLKFLVRATPEVGCFDGIELGPTIQREVFRMPWYANTVIDKFFDQKYVKNQGILFNHLLSEEGGRFYHEQNRNVIIKVDYNELPKLPKDYFLVDYRTLNQLVQFNNILNIQLRNLLSLLEG